MGVSVVPAAPLASFTSATYGSCPPGSFYGHKPASEGEVGALEGSAAAASGTAAGGYRTAPNGTFLSVSVSIVPVEANSTITGRLPFFTGVANAAFGVIWLVLVVALGSILMLCR